MSLIELDGVGRTVLLPDGDRLEILRDVTLTIEVGEHVSIVGRSGSGKSTLLNLMGLLDTPTEGEYLLQDRPTRGLSQRQRAKLRGAGFGFVFQQFNLLPGRTALQNVAAPLLYSGGRDFWRRNRLAADMLERVGLGERAGTMPEKLSGGEQQRVAIARSLIRSPRVILCDEPTGALDVQTGTEIMDLLDTVAAESGATLVTITHDTMVAARAHRHYRLDAGLLGPLDPATLPAPRPVVAS
ncbi:ABC transporter ATP-binding protein [Jiangella endophytica]|uniref:ABC transporter ATP-binding protein n=1 Tax=Jiangella endophytica TaxID=1623398 RepID=UPI000E34DA99|nr:ABC transporter ATP-binding protein [Jiangella endophytica]